MGISLLGLTCETLIILYVLTASCDKQLITAMKRADFDQRLQECAISSLKRSSLNCLEYFLKQTAWLHIQAFTNKEAKSLI